MKQVLRVALIGGGMYDGLYQAIGKFELEQGVSVTINFQAPHPELNAHLAGFDEPPYDLISTHSKYAPSQKRFLAPLDDFDTTDFFPAVVALATIEGSLYGVPRNIDLRLLHYRTDLMDGPPSDWDQLVDMAHRISKPPNRYGFVFTGMGSGLFGTFFELAEAAGARVFTESLVPDINNYGGQWALDILRTLYRSGAVPEEVTGWHFDEVHDFFRSGGAAMVSDWPGFYGSYREADSPVRESFRVARMPAGPLGKVCCYAGSHTFALTVAGAKKTEAQALLRFLTAPEQQTIEAQRGSVPVRPSVMWEQQRAATGQDAERLMVLSRSIDCDLIVPPKFARYPEVENILWRSVRAAMVGEVAIEQALKTIEADIAEYLAHAA